MVDYKDLGARIRIARRKLSLTQEQLAEQVGISASFMGHIERGSRIASLDTLVNLCNALKVSPQYLLCGSMLADYTDNMPAEMTPEQRLRLSSFLRMAQDTIDNWGD